MAIITNVNVAQTTTKKSTETSTLSSSTSLLNVSRSESDNLPSTKKYGKVAVADAMIIASAKDPNEVANDPILALNVAMENVYKIMADLDIDDSVDKARFSFAAHMFGVDAINQAMTNTGSKVFSENITEMVNIISNKIQYSSYGSPDVRAIRAKRFLNSLITKIV